LTFVAAVLQLKRFSYELGEGRVLNNQIKGTCEVSANSANRAGLDEWGSKYNRQFERLLDRIEQANTYYQVLGIKRAATTEQVNQAHKHTLALLNPFYLPTGFHIPNEIKIRIKQAEEQVRLAGSTLLHFGKRIEYDNSLAHKVPAPLPIPTASLTEKARANFQPVTEDRQSALVGDIQSLPLVNPSTSNPSPKKLFIGTIHPKEKNAHERRRGVRTKLSIPVYMTGYDSQRKRWSETARTIDISRFGIALEIRRSVRQGTVIHLALAMPAKLRTHDHDNHSYNVYAIVRRVQPPNDGLRIIAVEFLGERPPIGYLEQPWATFYARKWHGPDRRLEPRKPYAESVGIEYLNQDLQPLVREATITEDVSCTGMRVLARTAPEEFDYVRVTSATKNYSGVAAVRNRFIGGDGVERLCLNLLEAKWPM
jgi:hypothetical protein